MARERSLAGALRRVGSSAPLPLSFRQEQTWITSKLPAAGRFGNRQVAIQIKGPLSVPALRRAFAAFIRRHDAWRTVFSEVDGKPRQIVCDDVRLDLPVTSITHFPWEARESESRRIALEELGRDFGSFERQPVRALLVALRDEDHVLYVTAHSLVSDDASLRHVFVPELASMYRSESEGECTTAIEPVPPYADFALWQREAADEPGIDQLVNYWKERLADPPAVVLPIDHRRRDRGSVR